MLQLGCCCWWGLQSSLLVSAGYIGKGMGVINYCFRLNPGATSKQSPTESLLVKFPVSDSPPCQGWVLWVLLVQKVGKGFLGGEMRHTAVEGHVVVQDCSWVPSASSSFISR